MRKTDSEQVILLLKQEVDQLRIQNELNSERNQIQLETISQRNEELRLLKYSNKQKDVQIRQLEQVIIRKDEELALFAEQNKQMAGYLDPASSLIEKAEKILENQKALNLASTQSKITSSNALRYATFLTGALLNMQTQLISKEVLRKAFMEVNLQDLQITEDQAAKQYAQAVSELKLLQ